LHLLQYRKLSHAKETYIGQQQKTFIQLDGLHMKGKLSTLPCIHDKCRINQ